MEILNIKALVIRESDYGENDKLLTLLSAEKGVFSAVVKGGKSLKNKNAASSQLLCLSEFVLKERNGFYTLSEASLIEQFFSLRSSLYKFSLAQYVCEMCLSVGTQNEDSSSLMSLVLNTLYMLCTSDKDTDLIKAVFELRCAYISGFSPDIFSCRTCGKENDSTFYLDVMNGNICCQSCFGTDEDTKEHVSSHLSSLIIPLEKSELECMRYVTSANPKRIFSFNAEGETCSRFCNVCEKYLLNHIERGFKTLDFYKNVKKMGL